jgi:hypothetical protein
LVVGWWCRVVVVGWWCWVDRGGGGMVVIVRGRETGNVGGAVMVVVGL